MTSQERNLLLNEWAGIEAPWPEDRCLHELFEEQALQHPERVALVLGKETVSYGALADRIHNLALILAAEGVEADTPVALLLDRDIDMIVAIYGVLKANGFYVPMEPAWPEERLHEILEDTAASVVITSKQHRDQLPSSYTGTALCIDALPECSRDITLTRGQSSNAVYCLYTSGSSGKPKGVVVEHRGLVKRIQWLQDTFPLGPDDRILFKTPYTFGISEWELFWALPHGATVVIAEPHGHKDPGYLHELMVETSVSAAFFVPSMLAVMLDHLETASDREERLALKWIFTCGEALTYELCAKFFSQSAARLINLYGPTEADMTWWECQDAELSGASGNVPIGKPISNAKLYLLDEDLKPVSVGTPGELYFGGTTTARGYLNRPELTEAAFIPNPHSEGRLYRTGDLAKWLPDGNLVFLGRADAQIKLRGYRIELGEIESTLQRCEGVKQAVVLLKGDRPETQRLIAYVTPAGLHEDDLLKQCRAKLPDYMVPSTLITMDRFPLTDRDKIDRRRLAELEKEAPSGDFIRATSATEQAIERIWQEVLHLKEPISTTADFVDLGGSSLLAGYVTTRLRKAFDVHLPGTAIYTQSSIASLAPVIDRLVKESTKASSSKASETESWRGESPHSAKALAWQVLGVMAKPWIGSLAYYLVAFLLAFLIGREYGFGIAFLCVPFVMLAEMVIMAGIALTMKRLLIGRHQPGAYPVYGSFYWRWWLVKSTTRSVTELMESFFGGTTLFNHWLRLLGARIGKRSLIDASIDAPDLVVIGDDVRVDRHAKIEAAAIENGQLILKPIEIGNRCRVSHRAFVTPGTILPDDTILGPLSTTHGEHAHLEPNPKARALRTRTAWHVLLGYPLLLILFALPIVPEIYGLTTLHAILTNALGNIGTVLFWLLVPYVYRFILTEVFFLEVVLMKWLVIGRFRAGPRTHTGWEDFRYWFMERMTHNPVFKATMEPWANSEFLSIKYRMLGAKIGRRVNMDYFDIVEHDLLTVGDHCVFGSSVTMVAADDVEALPIVLKRYANVLDHCLILPGVTVGEGALCGSSTLGPKGHTFPDHSISTGSHQGKCLLLKQRQGDAASAHSGLPEEERAMIAQARHRHHSTGHWLLFNGWVAFNICLWTPLEEIAAIGVAMLWWLAPLPVWLLILLSPLVYFAINLAHALAVVMVKWLAIGRFRAGNYPFYGRFHYQWVMIMSALHSASPFLDTLHGTVFSRLFNRSLGADIGKDACLMTDALEADLLTVGTHASVNKDCDITCHTVENMVLKLAPVKLGNQSTLRSYSVVMPGGTMETAAVLLEQSQVLKGETVTANERWAGLPAQPITSADAEKSPARSA